ncbi:MAG: endonuclease/exonuclease/phosphatase family protein [Sphingobacteriaceae bacterium]|nr:endonuclease/exonuclease/phosphatase family protein [Cytophagaceae bacterium]
MTYFLQGLGGVLVLFSLIPLIRHDYWAFRVFEYPRAQKFILTLLVLVLILSVAPPQSALEWVFVGVLVLNLGYLFYQLFPYTFLAGVQLNRSVSEHPDRSIKLLICNIYQYNRQAPRLLALIQTTQPDVVLLAETDAWWATQTSVLKKEYPHFVEVPLENTYGMLLYSRLDLLGPEVKYLVEPDIPSIHTRVKLPSGEPVQLYCLHPTPPVPQENPRSTERDKEILLVGKLAKASPIPVIVAGDLNDVAWSYSTDLFQKTSGLLDPRRGRGFFNTFHAWYPWLRFPLDHIFCSNDFKLALLRRPPAVGSDHFPMLVGLVYDPQAPAEQPEPEPTAEERETVEEKIAAPTGVNSAPQAGKNPIGT